MSITMDIDLTVGTKIAGTITIRKNHTTAKDYHQGAAPANATQLPDETDTFRDRKAMTWRAAQLMRDAGFTGRALRMSECGDVVRLAECPKKDHRHLRATNLCRDRLCPTCATARSRKLAREVAAECALLDAQKEHDGWAMLTLTTENVPGDKLNAELAKQIQGWRNMARKAPMQHATIGWIRRFEITFNEKARTHHVHVHALMAMAPGYYPKRPGAYSSIYLDQPEWQQMWAYEMGVDLDREDLIVDVRRVDDRDGAAPEVTKYVTKVMEYQNDPDELRNLANAVKSRNLIQWGGAMRHVRKELGHVADDYELLPEDKSELCPVCGSRLELVIYRWMGLDAGYQEEMRM